MSSALKAPIPTTGTLSASPGRVFYFPAPELSLARAKLSAYPRLPARQTLLSFQGYQVTIGFSASLVIHGYRTVLPVARKRICSNQRQ
jgi:hypothetical protein